MLLHSKKNGEGVRAPCTVGCGAVFVRAWQGRGLTFPSRLGPGYVDSNAKMQKIIAGIEACL